MLLNESLAAFGGPGALDVDEITKDLSAMYVVYLAGKYQEHHRS